jgi:hypothetical protein
MKVSSIRKSGMPSIRIPVAPPGKSMPTVRDYDRKRQKPSIQQEIETQEREMEER